jgi:glycerol-3-phosphate dehydrogenase
MVDKIEGFLGKRGQPWTAEAPLPGGDFPVTGFDDQVAALRRAYPFIAARMARRLVRLYGTRAKTILGSAASLADLGCCFGADLYEAEVRHLAENEWALTAEDVLWRRTKRGLHFSKDETEALDAFLREIGGRHSVAAE